MIRKSWGVILAGEALQVALSRRKSGLPQPKRGAMQPSGRRPKEEYVPQGTAEAEDRRSWCLRSQIPAIKALRPDVAEKKSPNRA